MLGNALSLSFRFQMHHVGDSIRLGRYAESSLLPSAKRVGVWEGKLCLTTVNTLGSAGLTHALPFHCHRIILCVQVSCYPQSGCLFPALKAAGVTAVYSGHDHDNNYYADYDGVRLAYGAKTGYGTYGPAPGWLRGARLIVLREGQRFSHSETWLRFEDGTRMVQPPTEGKWLWHWIQWMLPSFYAQKVCNY